MQYYYVARTLFKILAENNNYEAAEKILMNLYKIEIVKEVIEDLKNPDNVFDYLPLPNKWDCNNCSLKNNCYYENVRKIYLKIKEIQKNNYINQKDLKNVFEKTDDKISI